MAMLHQSSPPSVTKLGSSGFVVRSLEIQECEPLSNGTIVCGGLVSVSPGNTPQIASGNWYRMECDDGRIAHVVIVGEAGDGFIFTGRFV